MPRHCSERSTTSTPSLGELGAPDTKVGQVGSRGLVAAFLHLAEADVVDDAEVCACPPLEALRIGAVGEVGVEVIEQVDAARVADDRLGVSEHVC